MEVQIVTRLLDTVLMAVTLGGEEIHAKQRVVLVHYGTKCIHTCGQCLNGNTECDTVTGRCPKGCRAGWSGDTYKTACTPGRYGTDCREACGHCLNGNIECDKETGHCSNGCGDGWSDAMCKTECDAGKYGDLQCDRFTGYGLGEYVAGFTNAETGCREKRM
ncbi:protein draper-like isoform X2 [Gigantopelta aegis]|uniref:protein draper-like isoform X2 n=1 Tax=Gigantopelta aegis TaxID=1735272 RepID=UPI001B887E9A|nr:protein draper-like isoform X2 [Gigantopelta aegis]